MYKKGDYQNTVYNLWKKYIDEGIKMPDSAPEGIRPIIYESWRRSKAHNVSHTEVKNKLLGEKEFARILKQNHALISIAHPYILNLYSYVKGSNFLIALTDKNGNVIDLVGMEGPIEKRAQQTSLIPGCNRNEKYAGTCGIGLCLALKQPVQIWGYEHYIKPHHNYVCTAAPIKNKNGEIIATLDVIGPGDLISEHTLGMVCAAVDGIEKEMKMKIAYEKIYIMNNQLSSTLEAMSSGIIVFDNLGIITQYNKRALNILKLPFDSIINQNIANLLNVNTASVDLLNMQNEMSRKEVSVTNSMGTKLSLFISAAIVLNNNNQKDSTVLFFEEQQKLNKLITKLGGFSAKYSFINIIGNSPELKKVKEMGNKAAQNDSNVLILGESGTGKDLLAQAIHNASSRADGPFIAINCGSLPKGLVESELFGYESGAFTGANKDGNPGKFELADGGTIFLDEIGDMQLEIQASLLRVIQNKEITRIGGKAAKSIDVRVIAATNSQLIEKIKNNRFREDLFYRLNVLSITMPPLRNRVSDIPILVNHFISEHNMKLGVDIKGISDEALEIIKQYAWPGNVRELENVIERALNLTSSDFITTKELPSEIIHQLSPSISNPPEEEPIYNAHNTKKEYHRILEALQNAQGNVQNASSALHISKRTLYRRIQKYGIDLSDLRLW